MFNLKCPGDERGISEVVGAILILGMGIAVGSVFYATYVQSSIHTTEANYMNDVRGTFIDLQSAISAMDSVGQWKLVSIPMNASFPPLVPTSGAVGTVSVDPGYAYLIQSGSIESLLTESILGSLAGLETDNDGSYLEVNQVIFNENFANTDHWIGPTEGPETAGDAYFDVTMSYSPGATGSICVLTQIGGLWTWQRESAYWETNLGDSLENYPNVTLGACFGKRTYWPFFGPDELHVRWRIDVENGGSWETVLSYPEDNFGVSGTLYWTRKNTYTLQDNKSPNPIKNKVRKIRSYMFDNLRSSLGGVVSYIWTDDITMWAGPPFLDNIIIESGQIMETQHVDNVVVTLGFWSKDSPSMENLYIKNFSDNKWEPLENGIVKGDDNKVYWVKNIGGADNSTQDNNPRNYIDENGIIRFNMVGENKISPFRLVFDYLNFQVNYENQYRSGSYQGYYEGSGKLVFDMKNYSYPDQTYIYDDGAVIVAQGNSSTMVSEPPLTSGDSPPIGSAFVNVEKGTGDNIVVTVNHFVLKGSPASISKGGYSSVRASRLTDNYTWFAQDNENVYITIPYSSDTANAWTNYLSEIAYHLNSNSDFNSKTGFNEVFMATANGLTLAITGGDNDRRIHYSETVTEIGFSLA